MTLSSLGHSNLSLDEFVAMLRREGIPAIADVRRFPMSRRHPWFNGPDLARRLAEESLGYAHFRDLGGMLRAEIDDPDYAGLDPEWRAYAVHVASAGRQIEALLAFAERHGGAALMCAERSPEQCHRRLLADALLARGHTVIHVDGGRRPHVLTDEARIEGGRLIYPPRQPSLF
jgi:uncharacterized protein (DUF488 family)